MLTATESRDRRSTAASVVAGDIAQTISLLGMNASIEAAHAGAAGRGFAVVAGEIGKLSILVGQKSAEIDRGLKEVVARVQGARLLGGESGWARAALPEDRE